MFYTDLFSSKIEVLMRLDMKEAEWNVKIPLFIKDVAVEEEGYTNINYYKFYPKKAECVHYIQRISKIEYF